MSLELRPYGVACNLACTYCYQQPQRDAGNTARPYDLDRMKAAVVKAGGGPFVLFGGEPLLLPMDDLEELFRWGFEQYGRNSIQTNGTLVTAAHIALFHRYRVEVGVSIDGPGALNDVRFVKSAARTRAATEQVEAAIRLLVAEGLTPGLIVTLHRGNALPEHLPEMGAWLQSLDRLGIRTVRLHLLESENAAIRLSLGLTEAENLTALTYFFRLQAELKNIRFDVVEELKALLLGQDRNVSCVWTACDPFTTAAVQGIEGNGQRSNCGRTNKDGIDQVKADYAGFERYLVLNQIPQEYGGCRDCRFFLFCKGQCPGTAIDGDWRNRTEHCAVWKELFALAEAQLVAAGKTPISLDVPTRTYLEQQFLLLWRNRRNTHIYRLLEWKNRPQQQAQPQQQTQPYEQLVD